jgi:hypothetical protein
MLEPVIKMKKVGLLGGGTFYKLSLCKSKGTFTLWVPFFCS